MMTSCTYSSSFSKTHDKKILQFTDSLQTAIKETLSVYSNAHTASFSIANPLRYRSINFSYDSISFFSGV